MDNHKKNNQSKDSFDKLSKNNTKGNLNSLDSQNTTNRDQKKLENDLWEILNNELWEQISEEQRLTLIDPIFSFLSQKRVEYLESKCNEYTLETIQKIKRRDTLELSIDESSCKAVLAGDIDSRLYGIKGSCVSQPYDFVETILRLPPSTTYYSQDEPTYIHGQKTVDLVRIAINSIPYLESIVTDPNSMADVGLRWDMILIFKKTYFFPLQIKSNPLDVNNSIKESSLDDQINHEIRSIIKFQTKSNLCDVNSFTKKGVVGNYANEKILRILQRLKESIQGIKKNDENEVYERNKWIEELKDYSQSSPLYIWASHDIKVIEYLIQLFVNTFQIVADTKSITKVAVNEYEKIYKSSMKNTALHSLSKKNEPNLSVKSKLDLVNEIIQILKQQIVFRSDSTKPKTQNQIESLDLLHKMIKNLTDLGDFYSKQNIKESISDSLISDKQASQNAELLYRFIRKYDLKYNHLNHKRQLECCISETFNQLVETDKKFSFSSLDINKKVAEIVTQLLEDSIYIDTEYYKLTERFTSQKKRFRAV